MGRWLIAAVMVVSAATFAAAQDFTTLKGHGGPIMDIAVAPDGKVATASFDNSVGLWEGLVPTWLEGHEAAVNAVAHWPTGTVIAAGDDFKVRHWHYPPHQWTLGTHKGKVTDLAVLPEAELVASASWDGTIGLWPLSGKWMLYPPLYPEGRLLDAPGGVNAVAFAGPSRLYAGTTTGTLLRFDLDSGNALPVVQNGFGINELIVTPEWIAYGAVDGSTRIIDHDGADIADFTLDRRPILAMAHSAATGQIAVGDGEGYIMVIDTANWRITRDFRAMGQGPVWALAFSPDGSTLYAGGLDDVVYAWPVDLLDEFDPAVGQSRSFLRDPAAMSNGERQFMRKCSICHALEDGPSRKAGPTLHAVFGRRAGTVPDYGYSPTLTGSEIVWDESTIDALFEEGPDHYIPGSKMPMQVIAKPDDRADLIAYLKTATKGE